MTVAPVEHALFSLEGGQAATTRMLREGVTGIICASDVLALGAIRAVRRAGLSVPGDVSVIGYDDSGWLNCTDPPLTTVRQPIESMGKAAVALLVNQMETPSSPARRSCSSSPSWSSAAPPAPPRCARRQKSRQSADTRLQKAEVSAAYGNPYPERARAFSRLVQLTHRAAPPRRPPRQRSADSPAARSAGHSQRRSSPAPSSPPGLPRQSPPPASHLTASVLSVGCPARLPPRSPRGPPPATPATPVGFVDVVTTSQTRVTGHIWSPCLQSAPR